MGSARCGDGDDFFSFMTDASEIFVDVVTGASEYAPARTVRHRTDPMTIVRAYNGDMALHDLPLPRSCCGAVRFLQLPRAVVTTDLDGLAAIFTLKEFPSSLHSQAAQVVSTMTLLSLPEVRTREQ